MSKEIKYKDAVPNSIVARYKEVRQQYEQEHVGIVRTIGGYPDNSERVVDWVRPYKYLKDGDRLYIAPPKRKPFEPEERQRLSKAYSTRAEQIAFEEGIIFAEISYGIGGGG